MGKERLSACMDWLGYTCRLGGVSPTVPGKHALACTKARRLVSLLLWPIPARFLHLRKPAAEEEGGWKVGGACAHVFVIAVAHTSTDTAVGN